MEQRPIQPRRAAVARGISSKSNTRYVARAVLNRLGRSVSSARRYSNGNGEERPWLFVIEVPVFRYHYCVVSECYAIIRQMAFLFPPLVLLVENHARSAVHRSDYFLACTHRPRRRTGPIFKLTAGRRGRGANLYRSTPRSNSALQQRMIRYCTLSGGRNSMFVSCTSTHVASLWHPLFA